MFNQADGDQSLAIHKYLPSQQLQLQWIHHQSHCSHPFRFAHRHSAQARVTLNHHSHRLNHRISIWLRRKELALNMWIKLPANTKANNRLISRNWLNHEVNIPFRLFVKSDFNKFKLSFLLKYVFLLLIRAISTTTAIARAPGKTSSSWGAAASPPSKFLP